MSQSDAESAASALATDAGAPAPWTLARNKTTEKARSDPWSWPTKSLNPSDPGLATRPTRRGTSGTAKRLIATQKALGLEGMEQRGPARRQPAQQRGDVDLGGDEVDLALGGIELDPAPQRHHRAGLENDALLSEGRLERAPGPAPTVDLQHRGVATPWRVGIDQVDVTVPRPVRDALDLASHPLQVAPRERGGDRRLHLAVEGRDGHRLGLLHKGEPLGLRVHLANPIEGGGRRRSLAECGRSRHGTRPGKLIGTVSRPGGRAMGSSSDGDQGEEGRGSTGQGAG